MAVELAEDVGPDHLRVAYERFGPPDAPPVLLVMGVAAQMIGWPDPLCEALAARGLHVIRFDNRDVGLSSHITGAPAPDIFAAARGDLSSASYTLSHMAADTAGLLDALGLDSAHVVGASMGGAIAQVLAIEHPDRVRSLTSLMATTGAPDVGQPSPATIAAFFGPPPITRDDVVARGLAVMRTCAGTGPYTLDESAAADRFARQYDRAHDPDGAGRQGVATLATGDRTARLQALTVPTLVIHGTVDQMVHPSGGRATATAIPGAELVLVDGLGHDLAAAFWPDLVDRVTALVARVEGERA